MKHDWKRLLSIMLTLTLVSSLLAPVAGAVNDRPASQQALSLTPVDVSTLELFQGSEVSEETGIAQEEYSLTDMVRVSIVLEKASTIEAGYSMENIAGNKAAMRYRSSLRAEQDALTARIEAAVGSELDVKWNLTLAANIISANIRYGDLKTIEAVPGVAKVEIETRYEMDEGLTADKPHTGPSSGMIGSSLAWAEGYTGAGSKVAIIDTGADIEHQSFSGAGLEHAYEQDDLDPDMLMTSDAIDAVADQLNVSVTGADVYINAKIPYGYNYVDKDFDVTHVNDTQGEHGSHVAGIATANRFVQVEGEWKDALSEVGVQGVAPDAQLVVMKVFGKGGGAYDSDYMVAIEDAIILGCDSANLSLGSGAPGLGFSGEYERIMNKLVEEGMVVANSAGNSGMWYDTPKNTNMQSYIYADDVSMATGGSPGTYTNALTVASVDNLGQTGQPLYFEGYDRSVFYAEPSGYGNEPIKTLAGANYEFVLVDGPGVNDNNNVGKEGDAFYALGREVLEGKIAMCYRGSSSFFAKANAAAAQGAVGVVIINNQDGVINMNLTGYEYTAPTVSILKKDGDAIKAAATSVDDGAGNVLYYTGAVSLAEGITFEQVTEIPDNKVTMSSFSSFGGPGTLVLKPEITAPGGSIYSVNGLNQLPDKSMAGGHDQYENMSGTSMAAPQVAGMAAVLGQYIRENDLVSKTRLTPRQLINSLLMSTSVPTFDQNGEYWSVLKQGSGLANVNAATQAKSYILMDRDATLFPDSARDGKVKAELGDDPERSGFYRFGFTLYPLTDEEVEYELDTDIFTQALAGDAGYDMLQDTATMLIGAEVSYWVGDQPVESIRMSGSPVSVQVEIELDPGWMEFLLSYFTNGFYVEGYTFVKAVADPAGLIPDVTHSIPIYGFCGSWTDPSMFDRTSAIDEAYGTGKLPYIANPNINYMTLKNEKGATQIYMGNPYLVEEEFPADRLAINGERAIVGFNYLPIRNIGTYGAAILNMDGRALWIGNLGGNNYYSAYYNVNQGQWMNTTPRNYSVNKTLASVGLMEGDKATVGFWALPEYYAMQYARHSQPGVAESGTLNEDGFKAMLASGEVGKGAGIAYTVTVDNTAPVVAGAFRDLITGNVTVKASDNQYIAYVGVMNKTGSKEYIGVVPEQTAPGQTVEVPLDMASVNLPATALLVVGDYAGNTTAFTFETGAEQEDLSGKLIGFTAANFPVGSGNRWIELDTETLYYQSATSFAGMELYADSNIFVRAAEYVNGYVFMASDDGYLYAASVYELEDAQRMGKYSDTTAVIYDMAYSAKDGVLYALGENNTVYSVDLTTGALTEAVAVTITNPAVTAAEKNLRLMGLAVDGQGNFYSINYGAPTTTFLYTFKLSDAREGKITDLAPVNNDASGNAGLWFYGNGGAMTWDSEAERLYIAGNWSATTDTDHVLFTMDVNTEPSFGLDADVNKDGVTNGADAQAILDVVTGKSDGSEYDLAAADVDEDSKVTTIDARLILEAAMAANAGKAVKVNQVNGNYSARFYGCLNGLFIVPGKGASVTPADEAIGLEVEPAELKLLCGQTAELTATVYPWNLADKSVTFIPADSAIATVTEEGVVTGVAVGTTTVTVTTNAAPNLRETVSVTVEEAPVAALRGIIWDEDGKVQAASFDSNATDAWQSNAELGQPLRWGALVDDVIYASTDDTMYVVDADTYEVTQLGSIVSQWIPSDAVAMPEDMVLAWGNDAGSRVGGLCNGGTYFEVLNPEEGKLNYWNLSNAYSSDPMAVVANVGRDAEDNLIAYVITESGAVWQFTFNMKGELSRKKLGETGISLEGVSDVTGSVWASLVYDEASEYLYLSHYDGSDDFARLYAINANDFSQNAVLGDFNEKVWPVVGLYQYEPATDLVLKVAPETVTLYQGEEEQLAIKVKLGATNEYTVQSSDPTVAEVDDTGLITALKEGTTTVTVTTVDTNAAGETLSETVEVTVKGFVSVEAFVTAQVSDGEGDHFVRLSLADLSYTAVAEAPGKVASGGRAGDIYMAGVGAGISALDAEDLTTPADYPFNSLYSQYPAQDIANYPDFVDENGEVTTNKALITTSIGWLVNPKEYRGWNLSSTDVADMAGIAFAGVDEDANGNGLFDYLLLTQSGTLYLLQVDYTAGKIAYQSIMDTGIALEDQSDASLAFINDVKYNVATGELELSAQGLVIADNGTKKVWYVDFMNELELGLIGTIDAANISGLVGSYDELISVAGPIAPDPYENAEVVAGFYFEDDPAQEGWTFVDADEDGNNWIWSDSNVNIDEYEGLSCIYSKSYANGSALTPYNWAISPAIDLSQITGDDKPILSLFAKGQDADYADEHFALYAGTTADPGEMTEVLAEQVATGKYKRYTADLSAFAGEETVYVAVRHFNCTDMFYLNVDQMEILTGVETGTAPAPVEQNLSDYAAPVLQSRFDGFALMNAAEGDLLGEVGMERLGSTANASRGGLNAIRQVAAPSSAQRGEPASEDAKNTLVVELFEEVATKNGKLTLTYDPAKLTLASVTSSLEYHSWNEDGTVIFAYASADEIAAKEVLATVKFTYTYDEDEGLDATVTVETKERNDDADVQEKPIEIPLTIYGQPVWTWEGNDEDGYTAATASFNDGAVELKDESLQVETTDPTCEEAGKTVYTASVELDGKTYTDTKEVVIDALGHDWGEPEWKWADDHSMAIAAFTCGRDASHEETVEATVTSEITDPTCEEAGKAIYTATVELDGKTYTNTVEVVIDALGHDWGQPVWTWNEDKTVVTATFTCGNDASHVKTETATVTSETTPPTTTTDGKTVYTATVELDGKTYTDTKEVTIPKTGGGGGGGGFIAPSTYKITVEKADNGSVSASRSNASGGANITVTPKADEGFQVDTVTVIAKNGSTVSVTENSDGTFTFTMPASDVTVKATFRAAGSTAPVGPSDPTVPVGPSDPTAPTRPSDKFTDVDGDAWYREAVDYVAEKGLMKGVSDDQFAPGAATTRAMIVTILYRLEGEPATESKASFDDVADGQWYTDAVAWAEANKIVEGYGNGKFGPTDLITREQFAAIMYRYASFKGYDVSKTADLSGFEDAASVSDWALTAMQWANAEGLITGRTATSLAPKGTATRAEAATILMRFVESIK